MYFKAFRLLRIAIVSCVVDNNIYLSVSVYLSIYISVSSLSLIYLSLLLTTHRSKITGQGMNLVLQQLNKSISYS